MVSRSCKVVNGLNVVNKVDNNKKMMHDPGHQSGKNHPVKVGENRSGSGMG